MAVLDCSIYKSIYNPIGGDIFHFSEEERFDGLDFAFTCCDQKLLVGVSDTKFRALIQSVSYDFGRKITAYDAAGCSRT